MTVSLYLKFLALVVILSLPPIIIWVLRDAWQTVIPSLIAVAAIGVIVIQGNRRLIRSKIPNKVTIDDENEVISIECVDHYEYYSAPGKGGDLYAKNLYPVIRTRYGSQGLKVSPRLSKDGLIDGEKNNTVGRVSKVAKVIDMGGWYHIIFHYGQSYFICQKNLIVKGTIKEFEKLFEGKIEVKK